MAARAAKRLGMPLSFDGNYRALLWESWDSDPKAVLGELIGMADILFGNHRDIGLVLGRDFSGEGPDRRREDGRSHRPLPHDGCPVIRPGRQCVGVEQAVI